MFTAPNMLLISLLALQPLCGHAMLSARSTSSSPPYQGQTIATLPAGANAENLAVRADGSILMTGSGTPKLFQVDVSGNPTTIELHTFPHVVGLDGIIEVYPDVFAIGAGNLSGAPDYSGTSGSWSVWTVNLTTPEPLVTKAADVKGAVLMDGFTTVPDTGIVYAADTQGGSLYRIDINDGNVTDVLSDATLAGSNSSVSAGIGHLGINGIKYYNDTIFFTNSAKQYLGQLHVDAVSNEVVGGPTILQNLGTQIDDLWVLSEDHFLVAANKEGVLQVFNDQEAPSSSSELIVSYPFTDACVFGRTGLDLCTLYMSFQGVNSSGLGKVDLTGSGVRSGC